MVQVGQCGNQIGDELFAQLALIHLKDSGVEKYMNRYSGIGPHAAMRGGSTSSAAVQHPINRSSNRVNSTFFTRDGFARCVLLDSEPKVVQSVYQRYSRFIRPENVVHGQSGRGNNWGLGYFGVNDPRYIKKRHEPVIGDTHANPTASSNCGSSSGILERGKSMQEEQTSHRTGKKYKKGMQRGEETEENREKPFQRNPLPTDSRQAFKNLHKSQRVQDDGLFAKALQAIYHETRRTADIERDESNDEGGLDIEEGFECIILLHSLSGGTGSGLASRLAERIRLYFVQPQEGAPEIDEVMEDKMRQLDGLQDCLWMEKRRAKYLISIALAPMTIGEVATQSINTALTLQLLLRHTDAVIILRNDDLLTEEETSTSGRLEDDGVGGPRMTLRTLLPSCITFKEANEVFVALLLPLFNYGFPCHPFQSVRADKKRHRTSTNFSSIREGSGRPLRLSSAGVDAIIRQVAPRGCRETGQNILLTVLPTPQPVYGRFRFMIHRCRFYGLYGGKEFLPGCCPEPPDASIVLSRRAAERHRWLASGSGTEEPEEWNTRGGGMGEGGEWIGSLREEQDSPSPYAVSSPLTTAHNRGVGPRVLPLPRRPLWQSLAPRSPAGKANHRGWRDPNESSGSDVEGPMEKGETGSSVLPPTSDSFFPEGSERKEEKGLPTGVKGKGGRDGSSVSATTSSSTSLPSSSAMGSTERPSQRPAPLRPQPSCKAERGGGGIIAARSYQTIVYDCVKVQVPPILHQYYATVKRSPISTFLDKIEGVALLNQVRELDAALLFPLLRSVAFKVKVGAYMSLYEEAGIPPTRIEQAYRTVAEALLNAEEIE